MATLAEHRLLAGARLRDLRLFASIADPFSVPAGWSFLVESKAAPYCYLLVSGTVGSSLGSRPAADAAVGVVESFARLPAPRTLRALTACAGYVIDARYVDWLVAWRPGLLGRGEV